MAAAAAPGMRPRVGWRATTAGELVAEFLGTFILICFGDGVVAMAVAALNQSGRGTQIFQASGDWLLIGWGWGFAVTFAVYVAGGVSGAHINPARDFGPRFFAWIAGWGKVAIPGDYGNVNSYLWIPIIGPFLGGLVGAYIYDFAIRDVLIARGEQPSAEVEERGRTVVEED